MARFYLAAVLLLLVGFGPHAPARGADKKEPDKVAGILIDKKGDALRVKADGEEEPAKYTIDASDKPLAEALKGIFDACRVQLTYKQDGEVRKLTGIKRQVLKANGTITGDVVKVYNDFWVEVKPKTGLADAYAPGPDNWMNKEFMANLKGLKPGDSVTITFTTDFERHRIKTMRFNPAAPPNAAEPSKK